MTDEYYCDSPELREFIGSIKGIVAGPETVEQRLEAIRPHFSRLMEDPDWLPDKYRRMPEEGGMGKNIANWLLYRAADESLILAALVLPPGAVTPVHDHLAWGMVGLYVGEQDEEVYEPAAPVGADDQYADLKLVDKSHLEVGHFYKLIPPTGDIHRVVTTSDEPSISLHLLSNDVGCVMRHRFEPDTGAVLPFQSGYSNQGCEA